MKILSCIVAACVGAGAASTVFLLKKGGSPESSLIVNANEVKAFDLKLPEPSGKKG